MILVIDDFLSNPAAVRQSAFNSGFGTWRPNRGVLGADSYDGVNYMGDHATPTRAVYNAIQRPIIPGLFFFRLTNPGMEKALIHSDREYGCSHSAIVYLSESPVSSGTGFYRHRATGWTELPPLEEFLKNPLFQQIKEQQATGLDTDWEQYKFVPGIYNRCLIFDSPKIHCRLPRTGYGTTEEDSRLVWVLHFNIL